MSWTRIGRRLLLGFGTEGDAVGSSDAACSATEANLLAESYSSFVVENQAADSFATGFE